MGEIAYTMRTVEESDWPAILRAADAALPDEHVMNRQWLAARQSFPADRFARSHYVVVAADEGGAVVGYGAIEGGERPDSFRMFVVMSPELLDCGPGDLMFARLRSDLAAFAAHTAWTRELARDLPISAFFRRHGLTERERYRTAGGLDVVLMELPLSAARATR